LISDAENPGLLLRTGRIRHVIGGVAASPYASSRVFAGVVAFLQA
jgi:hypothetical protein